MNGRAVAGRAERGRAETENDSVSQALRFILVDGWHERHSLCDPDLHDGSARGDEATTT